MSAQGHERRFSIGPLLPVYPPTSDLSLHRVNFRSRPMAVLQYVGSQRPAFARPQYRGPLQLFVIANAARTSSSPGRMDERVISVFQVTSYRDFCVFDRRIVAVVDAGSCHSTEHRLDHVEKLSLCGQRYDLNVWRFIVSGPTIQKINMVLQLS